MSEKIRLLPLIAFFVLFLSAAVQAHEDDYIVGLSAFRDGLYEVAAPSLEQYLSGDTDKHKADYSRYLLYQMHMNISSYDKAVKYLEALDGVNDRRFEADRMVRDKMYAYTKTDCKKASKLLTEISDDTAINFFLDSECKADESTFKHVMESASGDETRLKVAAKFEDRPELVSSVFDALSLESLGEGPKRYFALYFYKNGDLERFAKVREVYEDSDVVGLELDSLWQKGEKEQFISQFEKYKLKYTLTGANACRAFEIYKNSGEKFDCNIINECMQKYSVDFVKVKGACLVKNADSEMVTEFIDSLKPTIFPGICGYSEYIFHNGIYTGKQHAKFYQCEERYRIADILLKKGENQAVVNTFFKKTDQLDIYYTATALRNLGKKEAADKLAAGLKDADLIGKYKGAAQ